MERGNFGGEGRPVVKYNDTAVICAKTAEPIEMPFGLWSRVGPRKHVFDGAQILNAKGVITTGKDMPGHARRHSVVSCAKMAEPIDLPFGVWTRVGRRRHRFTDIRQVASMSPHGRRRCGLMFNYTLTTMPHRSSTYVDAAYCYRPSSVVCRSVGLHISEPCQNG